jgi:hypothetical protein
VVCCEESIEITTVAGEKGETKRSREQREQGRGQRAKKIADLGLRRGMEHGERQLAGGSGQFC